MTSSHFIDGRSMFPRKVELKEFTYLRKGTIFNIIVMQCVFLDFIEISVGRSIHQLNYECGLATEIGCIGVGWYFIRVTT
jgi:hypothetical protein